jgi:hypothetical protein
LGRLRAPALPSYRDVLQPCAAICVGRGLVAVLSAHQYSDEQEPEGREPPEDDGREFERASAACATLPGVSRSSPMERKAAREEAFLLREGGRGGALPDFIVVGAQKGGTTALYRLLTRHPLVQGAATKEVHFFDDNFEEGVGWYRNRFPAPRRVGGRETITGEATPYYIFGPLVPGRMARVVPEARLIALLRHPVERAYSHYQHEVRLGTEPLSFMEAVEAEEQRLRGDSREFALRHFSYLARGRYAEQILRYQGYRDENRMLLLKSEDFFGWPQETLSRVLEFLGLPAWRPPLRALRVRNRGEYSGGMDPATREQLDDYFEPHNRRLYELLGMDFGW